MKLYSVVYRFYYSYAQRNFCGGVNNKEKSETQTLKMLRYRASLGRRV